MAARGKRTSKTAKDLQNCNLCRDCIHSGNRIERNTKGEFFMCWCPFEQWAQFLNDPHQCKHFAAGDPIPDEPDQWEHHKKQKQ